VSGPARVTLRLSLACNNNCIFCAQRGLSDVVTPAAGIEARLAALRAAADEITFVGGEPTLDDRLPDAIAAARAAGFRAIGVQTNGRRLADAAFAERLVAAGLSDVHLSIHGASEAQHDYHTGVDSSFRALLAGMSAVRALGATIVVTTVLTRSGFRGLGELPALLVARGVAAWQIAVPLVVGEAARAFDRVVPRLGLALPFALHALDAAAARGLPAFISGAPLCALGPFAARALPVEADRPRAYAAACDACAARPACPGVDPAYLARWNGDELAPRAAPGAAPESALARLFVGVGEVAPAAAPAAGPRRLPVLGKAQPGRGEVTPATPKRSGEALREILPALFSDK
jgi:Radical SAM superfamily